MKAADLIGPALDWAAGLAEGHEVAVSPSGIIAIRRRFNGIHVSDVIDYFDPSTNWGWGGPIIERERIVVYPWHDSGEAAWNSFLRPMEMFKVCGPTPLIAAMRCHVYHRLGDEIDIPKELQ
jgi:hypothetical protein